MLTAFCALTLFASAHKTGKPSKPALRLYVSTTGNDSWSGKSAAAVKGTADGPFATPAGARNAIREMRKAGKLPAGDILVEIRGGTYELDQTFSLEAIDGGMDSLSRIIYTGQKDAEVRLSGGKTLTNWKAVDDHDVLKRFDPTVRGRIYQTDLKAAGITDYGSPGGNGMELFFNDKPMWISRYPNKGFMKITGLYNIDPVDVRGTKGDQTGKFNYDEPRISRWKDEKDAWVDGYWFWDWSEQRHKIANLDTISRFIERQCDLRQYLLGWQLGPAIGILGHVGGEQSAAISDNGKQRGCPGHRRGGPCIEKFRDQRSALLQSVEPGKRQLPAGSRIARPKYGI